MRICRGCGEVRCGNQAACELRRRAFLDWRDRWVLGWVNVANAHWMRMTRPKEYLGLRRITLVLGAVA